MAPRTTQLKSKSTHDGARPARLMLPILKVPLVLYRLHLGWLLGHRFMRLTHIGRKSGKVRHTVLLVLRYDPRTREVKVVSAWNASDWYRNIQIAPALEVETGRARFAPEQHNLSTEEIVVLFDEFRKRHRLFGRMVCRIPGWNFNASGEELSELARSLRGVAFRPKTT